jgi:replicative DNA helicase
MTRVLVTEGVLEAERAVLGTAMLYSHRDGIVDAIALDPADFYDLRHRDAWLAIRELAAARTPIDPVSVRNALEARGKAANIPISFLTDLTGGAHIADAVAHHAQVVAGAALKRRILIVASEILAKAAADSAYEPDELHGELLRAVSALERRNSDRSSTIGEILVEATRQVAAAVVARADGRDPEWLMPTGLLPLDRLIGGLYRGKLHVVAGRPSMGKSTLARTFAGNRFAAGDGVHVFSLEDDRIMYGLRVLADEGSVNLQRLVQARITPDELSAVTLGADRVIAAGADRWRVDDSAGISADKIAMAVRRHKRTLNTKLVVVDYAQILHEPDERERRQQIRRSAQVLHDLARDEGVAVVLVAQLNRGPERQRQPPPDHGRPRRGRRARAARVRDHVPVPR